MVKVRVRISYNSCNIFIQQKHENLQQFRCGTVGNEHNSEAKVVQTPKCMGSNHG